MLKLGWVSSFIGLGRCAIYLEFRCGTLGVKRGAATCQSGQGCPNVVIGRSGTEGECRRHTSPPSLLARVFGRGFEFVLGRKTRPYRSVARLGEGRNFVPSGTTSSEADVGEVSRSRRSDG
ncbi:unnamed protein product [Prunus armeniaca]